MDALTGDEVCAQAIVGAFVMTVEDALLLRTVLRDETSRLLDAGEGRQAVALSMLSRRINEFESDMRVTSRSFATVVAENTVTVIR